MHAHSDPPTDMFERLLGERPSRSLSFTPFTTSLDSVRRAAQRRAYAPAPPRISDHPASNSRHFPDLHAFVNDYWQRESDRQLEGFDRTTREAQEYRQRTAEFLARTEEEPFRSSLPSHNVRDATASSFSSGYSTLRGALDDSATRRRSLGSRAPSSSFGRPAVDRFNLRRALLDEPIRSSGQANHLDFLVREDPEPTPYLRNSGPPSTGREPNPPSIHRSLSSILYPTDSPSYGPTSQSPEGSYLEMTSRARSSNISGLRRRARARSRSPPSPPLVQGGAGVSGIWDDTDSLSMGNTAGSSTFFATDRRPRYHVSRESLPSFDSPPPPRAPSPDPLDSSIWEDTVGSSTFESSYRRRPQAPTEPTYSILPPRDPSPDLLDAMAPVPRQPAQSAAMETRARSSRNIDLDAFHEGPFRATLARSVAYSRQTRQQPLVSAERERPANTQIASSAFSDSSEDDDVPWSGYPSLLRQETRSPRRDLTSIGSQSRSTAIRNRPFAYSLRRLDDHDDVLHSRRARGGNTGSPSTMSTVAQPLSTSVDLSSTSEPGEPNFESQRPVDRLRDLVSRPGTGARRTLLGREHSVSRYIDDDTPALTLERWERRRQLFQHFSVRARPRDSTTTAATPASSAQQVPAAASAPRDSQRSERAASAFLDRPTDPTSRRYSRLNQLQPRNVTAAHRTEGPSPLNGRFARRGVAPDMVWVDFPSSHRMPHSRRRWHLGDYMVRHLIGSTLLAVTNELNS